MAASPQTENGFAMIANELLSAILHARFGLAETAVLQEVVIQMYGAAKAPCAVLNVAGIARDIDMHRQSVSRAVNRLVECNVLARVEGGVKILKDYEGWTRDGLPRLTPAMVAKAKRYSQPRQTRTRSTPQTVQGGATHGLRGVQPTGCGGSNSRVAPPLYRNGRDEIKRDDDEAVSLRQESQTDTAKAVQGPSRHAVLPSRPDGVGAVHDRPAPDPADELAAVIQATCPEIAAKLTPRLRSLTLAYPVDMVKQAIPEAFCRDLRGGPDAAVSYLLTTLRQWQADPTARTRPKPVVEARPKTYAKPAPKKNPADYDPYAKPTPETLATLAKLRQMVYDARA